jgi:hypothetical protein
VLAAAAGADGTAIPVQAFEIDQTWREPAVTSLLHAYDTVDAFDQAPGAPAVA